ncbi:type II toxin-antitoxin system Y4mF family antitoxin [Arthrobacter sp. UYCu723]
MAELFSNQLAAAVRARRATLRLGQRDLAELAGVSERFVRFVEQGKRSVQLDSLLALLGTLGLELQLATRTSSAARALAGGSPAGGPKEGTLPPYKTPAIETPAVEPAEGPGEPRP